MSPPCLTSQLQPASALINQERLHILQALRLWNGFYVDDANQVLVFQGVVAPDKWGDLSTVVYSKIFEGVAEEKNSLPFERKFGNPF
ncbi:MAG: hypothetical protein CM15mV74_520 [uncultured marine virus]|nr:MAG: hypothetical protein CM15mV74_520 [uncultured marine virus]